MVTSVAVTTVAKVNGVLPAHRARGAGGFPDLHVPVEAGIPIPPEDPGLWSAPQEQCARIDTHTSRGALATGGSKARRPADWARPLAHRTGGRHWAPRAAGAQPRTLQTGQLSRRCPHECAKTWKFRDKPVEVIVR